MVEEITQNVYAQWGAIGVLVSILSAANVVQWKAARDRDAQDRLRESQDRDDRQALTSALTELTVFIRDMMRK